MKFWLLVHCEYTFNIIIIIIIVNIHIVCILQVVLTSYSYHFPNVIMLAQVIVMAIVLESARVLGYTSMLEYTLERWESLIIIAPTWWKKLWRQMEGIKYWVRANHFVPGRGSPILDQVYGSPFCTGFIDPHFVLGPWTSILDQVHGSPLCTVSMDPHFGSGPRTTSKPKPRVHGPPYFVVPLKYWLLAQWQRKP